MSERTYEWPAVGVPWAHLVLVHGIAEHAGRHAHVAQRFASAGIAVHAYDLRGFGTSEGPRAYVDRWSQYHDDLEARLAAARSAAGGLPAILYGHSLGGLIALGYVLTEPPRPRPDVLVLSAPALDSTFPAWKRTAAAVLGRLAPTLRMQNGLAPGALSHDPAVETAYRSDPLNVHTTTTRLGMEALAEQERVARALRRVEALPLPTYVFQGSDDRVVPLSASALLEGKHNVTRRVYPGGRHELHNEPEGPSIIDDTIAWLREHAKP